jgi:hypothetical protein
MTLTIVEERNVNKMDEHQLWAGALAVLAIVVSVIAIVMSAERATEHHFPGGFTYATLRR